MTSISDESGNETRRYDRKGNVASYFRRPRALSAAVLTAYTYDAAGNVTGMTYPSGRVVTFSRDTLGRITGITTSPSSTAPSQTVASTITYYPFGRLQTLTHGNGLIETFTTDSDYRVTAVKLTAPAGAVIVDRALTWMGETLTGLTDNLSSTQSQTFTYTPTHRLATASGAYGSYTWTYDAVGNGASEQLGALVSVYAYPTTSNRLASITPGTGTARAFTYDNAGAVATDTRGTGRASPPLRPLEPPQCTCAPSAPIPVSERTYCASKAAFSRSARLLLSSSEKT